MFKRGEPRQLIKFLYSTSLVFYSWEGVRLKKYQMPSLKRVFYPLKGFCETILTIFYKWAFWTYGRLAMETLIILTSDTLGNNINRPLSLKTKPFNLPVRPGLLPLKGTLLNNYHWVFHKPDRYNVVIKCRHAGLKLNLNENILCMYADIHVLS